MHTRMQCEQTAWGQLLQGVVASGGVQVHAAGLAEVDDDLEPAVDDCVVLDRVVVPYVVMAYTVMAYIVMAYVVMAY